MQILIDINDQKAFRQANCTVPLTSTENFLA